MATPKQRARQTIDALLTACGWRVQDRAALDLSAGRGAAVREFSLKTGFADYLLCAFLQNHLHALLDLRYGSHREALWFIIFGLATVMLPQELPFVISKLDAVGAFSRTPLRR